MHSFLLVFWSSPPPPPPRRAWSTVQRATPRARGHATGECDGRAYLKKERRQMYGIETIAPHHNIKIKNWLPDWCMLIEIFVKTCFANGIVLLDSNCRLFADQLFPVTSETPVRSPIHETIYTKDRSSHTILLLHAHTHRHARTTFTAGTPAPTPRPSSSPRRGTRSS